MMRFANAKKHLGQVEQCGRQIMEQPEEDGVTPSVADLHVWHPDDRVAWIDVRIVVQHVAEHLNGDRIPFAGRAVDQLRCGNWPRADKPAHRYGSADYEVARDQIDDGGRIAGDRAEES